MTIKAYIHDRLTIFFNLLLILLGLFNILLVIFRVDLSRSAALVSVNTTLERSGFQRGSAAQLYQFAVIPLVIVVMQSVISWRMHGIKRGISVLILSLGIVAIVFSIVVSSAILNLNR